METTITQQIKLFINITAACQRREVEAGRTTPRQITVTAEIPIGEALDRGLVVIKNDGTVVPSPDANERGKVLAPDGTHCREYEHVPTVDEVLADWRTQHITLLARRAAERDAARGIISAWLEEDSTKSRQDSPPPKWVEANGKKANIDLADDPAAIRREALRRYQMQVAAKKEAEAEAQKAEAAAKEAEAKTWIEAHGSERLRLAVKLGMFAQCETAYREERHA